MNEDYVNFDTAKLLKEKEFDWKCIGYYVDYEPNDVKYSFLGETNSTWESRCYSAPTLQTAMKWLREVHDKSIEIRSQGLKATSIGWVVEIYNLKNQDEEYHHPYTFSTYEQACEAAIKYCLENLI